MRSNDRRRRSRSGLPRWLVPALAVSCAAAFLLSRDSGRGPGAGTLPVTPERARVVVRGVVTADGEAVPGARVVLFEDADGGHREQGATDSDGRYEFSWTPRAVFDLDDVFVRASVDEPDFAPTIAPAAAGGVALARWVEVAGRVVDAAGEPVDDAQVLVAVRHAGEGVAVRAEGGRFLAGRLAAGAPLDLAVVHRGSVTVVERRFHAGEPLLLRVRPGHDVSLEVVDPEGRPVPGARGHVRLPRGLHPLAPAGEADAQGRMVVPDASDGGDCLVEVTADGFLPAEIPLAPFETPRVVLWPARTLDLVAFDASDGKGIEPLQVEMEIRPPGDRAAWTGDMPGRVFRPVPRRPGERQGWQRLELPRCRVELRLSAPRHEDARLDSAADQARAGVRMWPLGRAVRAELVLSALGAPDGFPVVAADEPGGWAGLATMRGGEARLDVPPGRDLQLISPQAWRGFWLPLTGVGPIPEGRRREVALGLRAAEPLLVEVEPAVAGVVRVTDVMQEKLAPPQVIALEDGKAQLWLRPMRPARIEVLPEGNWYPHEGEVRPEDFEGRWRIRLRAAAGLRVVARDRAGNAVPFAAARLWEPRPGGRLDLFSRPRMLEADALGVVAVGGLVGGEAALELRTPGLRTWRSPVLALKVGEVLDRGEVELSPPDRIEGSVVRPDGGPAAGATVRVLEPSVRRLDLPGGASVDVYDLQAFAGGTAVVDEAGRFRVEDRTPRAGLLAVYPGPHADLAPMAFASPDLAEPVRLRELAYVELDAPESVRGVYEILEDGRAVLIKTDPPMSLRPLPVVVPAGRVNLFIRLRDNRWAAPILDLAPAQTLALTPLWRD